MDRKLVSVSFNLDNPDDRVIFDHLYSGLGGEPIATYIKRLIREDTRIEGADNRQLRDGIYNDIRPMIEAVMEEVGNVRALVERGVSAAPVSANKGGRRDRDEFSGLGVELR